MRKAPVIYQIVDILWNKLRVCFVNNVKEHSMKNLCIDKRTSSVMVIGTKYKSNSWNLFDLVISIDSD